MAHRGMEPENSDATEPVFIKCANTKCKNVTAYSKFRKGLPKYCNAACERQHKGLDTVAAHVISLLGGSRALANRLKAQQHTVISWRSVGIPPRYHFPIVAFAEEKDLKDVITFEVLHRTVSEGRAIRLGRADNKRGDEPDAQRHDATARQDANRS